MFCYFGALLLDWIYVKLLQLNFFCISFAQSVFVLNVKCLIYSSMVSVMGKVEGQGESWHGHVTAVTVSPEYRRQQLAKKLMNLLEDVSDKM